MAKVQEMKIEGRSMDRVVKKVLKGTCVLVSSQVGECACVYVR